MAVAAVGLGPTLEDARRAADALVAAGVSEVWLYGSVARGEQWRGSDIDLVAVFDDLDYRTRRRVTEDLERSAAEACGQRVQVLVTDRPEWRIQREQVTASFASAISCDLKLLCCSPDLPGEVDWDKAQVMATSNEELAAERLENAVLGLTKIRANRAPGPDERELAELDDPGDYLEERGARLIMVCEAADMVIENAAKALASLEDVEAKTLWTHDVKGIVEQLDDDDTDSLGALMAAAPELVKSPNYITMWRTVGVYGTPGEGKTVYEVATPAFASAIALIACDVALYVADAVGRRADDQKPVAKLRQRASAVRDLLIRHDITTGKPLPAAPDLDQL